MMISLKAILSFLFGFSLLFPTCFLIWMPQARYLSNSAQETNNSSRSQEFLGYHPTFPTFDSQNVSIYKFIHPQLAYKILMELDVEPQFDNNNMNIYGRGKANLGFKRDDSYCAKRQEYFAQNAALLFEEANIVNGYTQDSVPTTVVSSFADDLHYPNIQGKSQKQKEIPQYDMLPSTDSFFTVLPLHFFYDINKQCSCLSQMSNQIPGCGNLASKHKVSQAITTYMKKYQDRPQCLDYSKFFLQSWVLSDTNECKDFFGKLNSLEYEKLKQERTIVFIKKISNTHRGEGVIPLHQEEETNIKNEYRNGALCGQVKKDIIMQNYIHNSLNLNGHKFDFRMYLLIASVNPLIAYYHDGFLRVSLLEYDATSNDKKVLLTNLALNKQIYDDAGNGKLFEGMNPEDLKEAQQWSFHKLQTYLLEKGLVHDPNWLDSYLRPEFKKALIHLVRLSSDQYVRHSSFYGLMGVDFMLDTDLKLWFIEANAGPAFDGYSQSMEKFIFKMIKDHFEIVFGLLRSRMKRVVDFVNNLIEKNIAYQKENGTLVIREVDETKRIFKEITKNYFEKEFEVDKSNGFEKIIDENKIDIYQGLLDEKCL